MTTEKRIFLTLAVIFFLFMQWTGWMEISRFALTRAIVEEGRVEITSFASETGDWLKIGDQYYIPQAPGISLLAVPIHAFSVLVFSTERPPENENIIMMGAYEREFVLPTHLSLAERFSMIVTSFLLSGFLTIATAYLLFLFSKEFIADKRIQYLVLIGYALGTLAFSQALVLQGHAAATFFVFAAFFVGYYTIKKRYFSIWQGGIFAGILSGIAFWVDYLALFAIIGIGFWFFLSRQPKLLLAYGATFALMVAFLLVYVIAVFGTPFLMSYDVFLSGAQIGEVEIAGERIITEQAWGFLNPAFWGFRIMAIVRMLVMPERGILLYFPFLVLAIPGIFFLARQRPTLAVMVGIIFFSLVWSIAGPYFPWWGSASFGLRHLTLTMPFLMIPTMFTMRRWHIAVSIFLIAVSVFVNILGLQCPADLDYNFFDIISGRAKEYRTAMISLSVIQNPLADYYWPRFKEYGINMPLVHGILVGRPFDIRSYFSFQETKVSTFSTPFGFLSVSRVMLPFFVITLALSFIWFDRLKKTFWKYLLIVAIIILAIFSFRFTDVVYGEGWHKQEAWGLWVEEASLLPPFLEFLI